MLKINQLIQLLFRICILCGNYKHTSNIIPEELMLSRFRPFQQSFTKISVLWWKQILINNNISSTFNQLLPSHLDDDGSCHDLLQSNTNNNPSMLTQ